MYWYKGTLRCLAAIKYITGLDLIEVVLETRRKLSEKTDDMGSIFENNLTTTDHSS